MTTIKDVAKAAGVSTATVSRVVNNGPKVGEKTRAKVLQIMAELGYTPNENARALVTQKSRTLGVVIPDITDPFFASLAKGVESVASENNMQLLLSTCQLSAESELQAIQLLEQQRCDTIVAHSKMISDDTLIKLCQRLPGLVLIDRFIEAVKDKCVWLDNYKGGEIAAAHLISLNHQAIACINSHYEIDDPKQRLDGFKNEAFKAGLILDENLITSNEPSLIGGELAARALLAKNKAFSAVFAYNDAMAIGAISVFEEQGLKVPDDITVLGFDDVLLSQYSRPKLTTLNYPIVEMAQHAAQLALALQQNITPNLKTQKYVPSLVKRDSDKVRC